MPNIDWTNKNTLQNLIDTIHARLITKVPHYAVMPTASADLLGEVAQFVGETDVNYTNAFFYKCNSVEDETTGVISYAWEAVDVQAATSISAEEDNAIVELPDGIYVKLVQVSTMPEAVEGNVNVIYQFVGETTADYTCGYFYKNVATTDDTTGVTTYAWTAIDTQFEYPHWIGTTAEFEIALNNGEIEDNTIVLITDDEESYLVSITRDEDDSNTIVVTDNNGDEFSFALDPFQMATMPEASEDYLGKVVQFIGETTVDYTQADFYICVEVPDSDPTEYIWNKLTYNKEEVDNLIDSEELFIEVNTLPTTDIKTNAIYLVPKITTMNGYSDGTTNADVYVVTGTTSVPTYDKYEYDSTAGYYKFDSVITGSTAEDIAQYIEDETYTAVSFNAESRESNNIKTEYINLDGTVNGWELIGNRVDSELSKTSVSPVQNKVITEALEEKYPIAWDVELTQAEYDLLDPEKESDDKNYYITDGDIEETVVYGWSVDPDEADPSNAVTYLMDAIGMSPAAMGTTSFNYGSWEDAFFMPRPCMLKYDGTVDYYLNPNDYSKKEDGTPSDISNVNYAGNAMMEWGLIWFKFEAGAANGQGSFYVSNKQIDNTYHAWCNYDAEGNLIPHFYTAIYNGTMPNGLSDKMRSLSGLRLTPALVGFNDYSNSSTYEVGDLCKVDTTAYTCTSAVTVAEEFDSNKWQEIIPNNNGHTTGTEELTAALANNITANTEWYINVWCDTILLYGLEVLMSKSLDLQSKYGNGIVHGGQPVNAKNAYVTGSANDKGLFYGSISDTDTVVKVFGMENTWGLVWHRLMGLINVDDTFKYKLTMSQTDGSTVDDYNTTGIGYLTADNTSSFVSNNGYVSKMAFGDHGLLPKSIDGTSSTYYCDVYYNDSITSTYPCLVGGSYNGGFRVGFCISSLGDFSSKSGHVASTLSCKPMAN